MTTADEKKHLSRVAGLGCIISGCFQPACCHHIRSGQGMGQRAGHYETIPLCYHHHQGKEGIHHLGTKRWQAKYGYERELLAKVLCLLAKLYPSVYRSHDPQLLVSMRKINAEVVLIA